MSVVIDAPAPPRLTALPRSSTATPRLSKPPAPLAAVPVSAWSARP